MFDYYQHNAHGGISIGFTDGTNSDGTCAPDQNGDCLRGASQSDQWTSRRVDLGSVAAGKTVAYVFLENTQGGPVGDFDVMVADMVIVSQDGTITPIVGRSNLEQLAGNTYPCNSVDTNGGTWPVNCVTEGVSNSGLRNDRVQTTTYYLADQVGTTQMELNASGWPIWQGFFTPFGQEIIAGNTQNALEQVTPDGTSMPYKFTGKERDAESGLDNFGARYYGSNMGRFMSPDSYGGRLADPQSLNKYAYARNNPLIYVDPDGHDFNLTGCGTTNTATCNNNMVGTTSTDGKNTFTATVISNGANGLQDQAGNAYSGTVTSAGVSFSQNGSNTSYGGSWINGSNDTSFSQTGGALNGFSFNFSQPNTATGQTLAGTFSYGDNMSASQAGKALEAAGFSHSYFDAIANPLHGYDVTHYRGGGDPKTGAGAAHFILDDPYKVDDGFVMGPVRAGDFHYGETDPRVAPIQHIMHDVIPSFFTPH